MQIRNDDKDDDDDFDEGEGEDMLEELFCLFCSCVVSLCSFFSSLFFL